MNLKIEDEACSIWSLVRDQSAKPLFSSIDVDQIDPTDPNHASLGTCFLFLSCLFGLKMRYRKDIKTSLKQTIAKW
ncbi:hypothetical protein BpHYR1_033074 [Brachionus plicatilis]|uniref:Uncharacterized protein n=1 Tax=Brachionus plicatilis TaxID=10195 RepID=A0A3M7RIZ8_BRAPC|nr:hypothetical protein BpHYR1_033074 [Brachionus plicatilis]